MTWDNARLHVGCGAKHLAGWLNVDAVAAPVVEGVTGHPDAILDVTRDLGRVPSDALAQVYWSHGVEHVFVDLLPGVLAELCRVLRPSGQLTLCTTSLEGIYQHRFLAPDNGPYWECALFGAQRSTDAEWQRHRDAFTYPKLEQLLKEAGFATVRPWAPSEYPEIAALRDCSTLYPLVSVYAEGVKA